MEAGSPEYVQVCFRRRPLEPYRENIVSTKLACFTGRATAMTSGLGISVRACNDESISSAGNLVTTRDVFPVVTTALW